MNRVRRAYTLVELIVYFMTSALVMWAIVSMFISGRKSYEATSSSYLVSKDAEAALRWIRADLQETALTTVRVYPNDEDSSGAPGISMASARNLDEEFEVNAFGAPKWQTYVYYTLDKDGVLTRWIEEHEFKGTPVASDNKPSNVRNKSKQRVILRSVAKPGQELPGFDQPMSERGGLDLQFVRITKDGKVSLSNLNPAQATATGATGTDHTKLIDLQLTVVTKNSSSGKDSYVQLPIRVMPRH